VIQTIISFVLIALIVYFVVVLSVNKLIDQYKPQPAPTKDCSECTSKIPEAARRCPKCAAQLLPPSDEFAATVLQVATPSGADIADTPRAYWRSACRVPITPDNAAWLPERPTGTHGVTSTCRHCWLAGRAGAHLRSRELYEFRRPQDFLRSATARVIDINAQADLVRFPPGLLMN
jgi:hypothetical protein